MRSRFISRHGRAYTVVDRRELWGEGRLIWAIEHAGQLFETAADAERHLS